MTVEEEAVLRLILAHRNVHGDKRERDLKRKRIYRLTDPCLGFDLNILSSF